MKFKGNSISKLQLIHKLLSAINQGYKRHNLIIIHKTTNIAIQILTILRKLSLIWGFTLIGDRKEVLIYLKWFSYNTPAILDIKFISKKTNKIFISYKDLKKMNAHQQGVYYLISTAKYGIISDKQAVKLKVGGELLVKIT